MDNNIIDMTNFENTSINKFEKSPILDAFGRIRVSEPNNRFDCEFINDEQTLITDQVTSGGGTITHNANSGDLTLAIGDATNGSEAAVYSHYDIPYTAGCSQLIEITGTLDNAAIGGGTASVFLRSSVSGSVVETVVDKASWDDTLDSNQLSDLDFSFSQIFAMQFQSLKVGRIDFGFSREGEPVAAHGISNDNIRTTGYWQRPTLPVCWRIYNDSGNTISEIMYGDESDGIGFRYTITANAGASMRAICGTVKSEGGGRVQDLLGYPFSYGMGTTSTTVGNTLIPVLSLRMADTFNGVSNRGLAVPTLFDLQIDNPIYYEILYRPTLTGASFESVDANFSAMEYDTSATAVSGGIVVDSGYASTGKNIAASVEGFLGRTIMSLGRLTPDILTFAAIRTTNTSADTSVAMKWKELR